MDTLHFAYGSNMDARQMALRCPRSRTAGLAQLPGWRFRINSQGWATIIPDSESRVLGRLWTLPPEDEAALDLYEDLPSGLYTKQELWVTPHNGSQAQAMTYLATDSSPGVPLGRYFQPILAAAIECGFPENYLRELQQWVPPDLPSFEGRGNAAEPTWQEWPAVTSDPPVRMPVASAEASVRHHPAPNTSPG